MHIFDMQNIMCIIQYVITLVTYMLESIIYVFRAATLYNFAPSVCICILDLTILSHVLYWNF